MEKLEQIVLEHLHQARANRNSVLWVPGANSVLAVVAGLRAFVGSGVTWGTISSYVAEQWIERCVELLLAEPTKVDEQDLAEALDAVRTRYLQKAKGFGPRSGDQLGMVLLVMLVERLVEDGTLSHAAAAALLLAAHALDDQIGAMPLYGLRTLVLLRMESAFRRVSDQVRHADLLVAWKAGIAMVRERSPLMPGLVEPFFRELPEAIERRIQETHDGKGAGPRPDRGEVASARQAERVLRAGQLVTREPFRSLPELRAEVLHGLALLLVEGSRDIRVPELEEAFRRFEQAVEAFSALGKLARALDAVVCAAECLERLADLAGTDAEYQRRIARLMAYGRSRIDWCKSLPVPEAWRLAWVERVAAAHQRARWEARLLVASEAPASGDEPPDQKRGDSWIQKGYNEAALYLMTLREKAWGDPWRALVHGRAACMQLREFGDHFLSLKQKGVPADKYKAMEQVLLGTLRRFLDKETLDAFIEALSRARDSWQETSAACLIDPASLEPLASHVRWQEAVVDFIGVLGTARKGLTGEQLERLAETAIRSEIIDLPAAALGTLLQREPTMLASSIEEGVPLEPVLAYLSRRLEVLDRALADSLLSAAERNQISGWISNLVGNLRLSTGDLAALEPEEALALLDLSGASTFRAEAPLYARGEPASPFRLSSFLEEDMRAALAASPQVEEPLGSTARLFANLYMAQHELDLWSRLKMSVDVGRGNPVLQEYFAPLFELRRTTVLEADLPPEQIEQLTGEPRENWERKGDHIIVHQRPEPDRLPEQVARARRWLLHAHGALADIGAISFLGSTPRVTPQRLKTFLAAHPRLAIVVPGYFPESMTPFSVFHHREGRVVRQVVGSIKCLAEGGPGLGVLEQLFLAIGDDLRACDGDSWRRLEESFEAVRGCFEVWARLLAEVLDAAGLTEVLFLLRGGDYVFIPWEELRVSPDGPRFEERYRVGYLHTLAELPEPRAYEGPTRAGVAQFYGDGTSREQMAIARAYQEALARDGCGRPPVSGSHAAEDALGLHRELRAARRVRFFLHGHHDQLSPESDRITLVDAERAEARIDLKAYELRRLPLAGMESVELWACEGAAYGRALAEHGAAEEPEDLTTSFLLAGARRVVASRWHVPTLPSALLMERFGLLLEEGLSESCALAKARSDCREAFVPGGFVEREMRRRAEPLLAAMAAGVDAVEDARVSEILAPAFDAALEGLRTAWREGRGLAPPGPTPNLAQAMGRLARYSAPRPDRLGAGLRADAPAWAARLVTEHLRPYRSPMCWAGWRLVIRSLEEWRP